MIRRSLLGGIPASRPLAPGELPTLASARFGRRARVVLHYLDYRDVQGVLLPARIERVGAVGERRGARLGLSSLAFD